MRLKSPSLAPRLTLNNVDGKPIVIGGASGRRTLICFFRDAACPFCNFRIYQLTQHHASLSSLGLDIVAVFTSTPEEVRRFVAHKPRPFTVIADPTSHAQDIYGIEHSFWRKWMGVFARIPTLLKGLRIVGLAGLNTSNRMPADFLVDEDGRIVEAYYGGDAGDRIPFERVELFLAKGLMARAAAMA